MSIITCKSNIKWLLIQTDWNEIKENDIAILCDAIQNRAHKLILAAASHFIKNSFRLAYLCPKNGLKWTQNAILKGGEPNFFTLLWGDSTLFL